MSLRVAIVFFGLSLSLVALLPQLANGAPLPSTRPAFTTVDQTWHDAARDRDIPVRLYLPAVENGPAPTIIVSHGLGDTRLAMAYACQAWASHGYIVAAIQHIGSDDSIWKGAAPGERFHAIFKAASIEQFLLRCGDVKFTLDELTRENLDSGPLSGRIDIDRFGLAGHSFGALTTQAIIGQKFSEARAGKAILADDRIKAAVIMSPGIEGVVDFSTAFVDIHVPTFHFTGTADVVTGLGDTPASKRRVPFDRMINSDRYLLTFDHGDHLVFSGHQLAGANPERYEHIQSETAKWSTDFWDATLRHDPAAAERLDDAAAASGAVDHLEHLPASLTATTRPVR